MVGRNIPSSITTKFLRAPWLYRPYSRLQRIALAVLETRFWRRAAKKFKLKQTMNSYQGLAFQGSIAVETACSPPLRRLHSSTTLPTEHLQQVVSRERSRPQISPVLIASHT